MLLIIFASGGEGRERTRLLGEPLPSMGGWVRRRSPRLETETGVKPGLETVLTSRYGEVISPEVQGRQPRLRFSEPHHPIL